MFFARELGGELLEFRTAQESLDLWGTPDSEIGNVR
jgi:hypothetical protein